MSLFKRRLLTKSTKAGPVLSVDSLYTAMRLDKKFYKKWISINMKLLYSDDIRFSIKQDGKNVHYCSFDTAKELVKSSFKVKTPSFMMDELTSLANEVRYVDNISVTNINDEDYIEVNELFKAMGISLDDSPETLQNNNLIDDMEIIDSEGYLPVKKILPMINSFPIIQSKVSELVTDT